MADKEAAEQTTTEVQDPAPEAQQPEAQPAAGAGPWASDLASLGLEGDVLTSVDGYLREKWQPRVTQLEQNVSELAPAQELYSAFEEAPGETFLEITEELFGADVADSVQALLSKRYEQEDEPAAQQQRPPATEDEDLADLPPRVRALVERQEQQDSAEAYNQELARVKQVASADPQLADVDDDLFHPFVVTTEGDFDAALDRYQEFRARFAPPAQQPAPEVESPPTVLGSDVPTPPAPPTQKRYESLDDAMDDFLSEVKAEKAPNAMGSV